jgi:hypothetical protein
VSCSLIPDAESGISVADADGTAQTEALVVSFTNLPEGAIYDAQNHRLTWTPGPGQIGEHVVTATVSDGFNTRSETFLLRVVADREGNAPNITVTTTPGTPALPGQTVLVSVRAPKSCNSWRTSSENSKAKWAWLPPPDSRNRLCPPTHSPSALASPPSSLPANGGTIHLPRSSEMEQTHRRPPRLPHTPNTKPRR